MLLAVWLTQFHVLCEVLTHCHPVHILDIVVIIKQLFKPLECFVVVGCNLKTYLDDWYLLKINLHENGLFEMETNLFHLTLSTCWCTDVAPYFIYSGVRSNTGRRDVKTYIVFFTNII